MHTVNTHLAHTKKLLDDSIQEINDPVIDFTNRYFAAGYIQLIAEKDPEVITFEAIETLEGLLCSRQYMNERRGYFIYKRAAEALAAVIRHSGNIEIGRRAYDTLVNTLGKVSGFAHRVSSEALGTLPFQIAGTGPDLTLTGRIPWLGWPDFLKETGIEIMSPIKFIGRSLVARTASKNEILVLKIARSDGTPENLFREIAWIKILMGLGCTSHLRFDIPEPIQISGKHLFRLKELPLETPKGLNLHPERFAISFLAHKDYFVYPNHSDDCSGQNNGMDGPDFKKVIVRNAWILGRLASLGIIHEAPIPLFHNRVERHRRRDLGLYEWFRAGRLDRWLESCRYPNIGLTGPRDFEHFAAFNGPNLHLYRHIGTHLLSLMLLCGSYFRYKDMEKIGFDESGRLHDAKGGAGHCYEYRPSSWGF